MRLGTKYCKCEQKENATYTYQSTFNGCWMLDFLSAESLQSALPDGFLIDDTGKHPAVFFFGDQLRGAFFIFGRLVSAPISYNEWGLLFQMCYRKEQGERVTFILRMLCTYPIAFLVGKYVYGYEKQPGNLFWKGTHFHAGQSGKIMDFELDKPAATSLAPIIDLQSILGNRVVGCLANGELVYSQWNFDHEAAEVWQVAANYQTYDDVCNNLTIRPGQIPKERGLMVRALHWQVTLPTPG